MNQPEEAPAKVGDELHLREVDYCYGTGPLLLRIIAVHEVQHFNNDAWLRVCGTELRPSDKRPLCDRVTLVRLAVLPATRPDTES